MNLCSPIMMDTFFMISVDSRLVATRNWRLFGISLRKCPEKGGYKTDYMRYGSPSQVFTSATADGLILKVLRPDG